MRTCLISPEATEDLDEIFDYFASKNVEAGERFVITFEKKCEKLLQFPNMGRSYGDIEPSLRGIPLDNYIILYRLIGNGVEIVRVVSGYRNLEYLFE
ncbi:type II toxin-antitoxin system RelE/ParE family toxin [Crocosphaera sp. XPORK-15E]|uniref:type II toxin-antitoxin system RelE/ParE family toxin n=1 Tax=Crocosphaera sp. XPORK-15E TaxID=3110247 RepID=UPI002B1FB243|nr:type II toxin-antitoxin system RelE/ParE family toxin [Crocosphaera sp. XPORK-15E]MEA5534485.1 type II toxin-antitoxin system RelE/ParE family toxin [Crocosphaera sp. XPORK-15E]